MNYNHDLLIQKEMLNNFCLFQGSRGDSVQKFKTIFPENLIQFLRIFFYYYYYLIQFKKKIPNIKHIYMSFILIKTKHICMCFILNM